LPFPASAIHDSSLLITPIETYLQLSSYSFTRARRRDCRSSRQQ